MPKITKIRAYKVLNSRADWTIKTDVTLDDGTVAGEVVPEGASKGENEAIGLPAEEAVHNVNFSISRALVGKDASDQKGIDELLIDLDGTPNKSKLGGNAILSVSLAVCKATAASRKLPLFRYLKQIYGVRRAFRFPTPVFNIINGGKHAKNNLSFQEFMVIPAPHIDFEEQIETGVQVYQNLKKILADHNMETGVGDEGGFAPEGLTPFAALKLIKQAASKNYKVGEDVFLGVDVAAESFYENGKYNIKEEKSLLTPDNLLDYYAGLLDHFELIYVEDPYYEKDVGGWKMFKSSVGRKVMTVGDDLVVTNSKFLKKAIDQNLISAVIVKPNQVGTLTETLNFIKMAQNADLSVCLSHRSGDTAEDTFISDLAVAVGADFIKSGAPARGERVTKYNRLLEIYHSIR